MDIGVYPLPDEEWVLGKSGLKALQYMGVGVPVVASRIGAACEFIRDGENGRLVGSTEEWVDALAGLAADPALRARMGAAGRATVEARYSVRGTAPVYLRVIDSILGSPATVGHGGKTGGLIWTVAPAHSSRKRKTTSGAEPRRTNTGDANVVTVACPLCGSEARDEVYREHGALRVVQCRGCSLFYTSPRVKAPEEVYWGGRTSISRRHG